MPTQKEIIVGHPANVRLGLIQVLCKNYAKTMSSIETIHINNLSQVKHIDGRSWNAWTGADLSPAEAENPKMTPFQDLLSKPQSKTEVEQRTDTYRQVMAHFKTFFQDPCIKPLQIESKHSILSIICQLMSTPKSLQIQNKCKRSNWNNSQQWPTHSIQIQPNLCGTR